MDFTLISFTNLNEKKEVVHFTIERRLRKESLSQEKHLSKKVYKNQDFGYFERIFFFILSNFIRISEEMRIL